MKINNIMKTILIIFSSILLTSCNFGGTIDQGVHDAWPLENYYSTRVWYNNEFLKEYRDPIDSVTPELRARRYKEAEELIKNFE